MVLSLNRANDNSNLLVNIKLEDVSETYNITFSMQHIRNRCPQEAIICLTWMGYALIKPQDVSTYDESVATNVRANVLASVGQLEQTEVQQPILPFGATSLPTTAKSREEFHIQLWIKYTFNLINITR